MDNEVQQKWYQRCLRIRRADILVWKTAFVMKHHPNSGFLVDNLAEAGLLTSMQ